MAAIEFFEIDKATGRIVQARSDNRGRVPADTETRAFLVPSAEEMARFKLAFERMESEGRHPALTLDKDGKVEELPDDRPHLAITADRWELNADGQDEIELTFTRLDRPDGELKIAMFQKLYRLVFEEGVCRKRFRTTQSGEYPARSDLQARLDASVTITAFD